MRDRTTLEINLALIRHGATKSNLEYRYLGTTEEALSDAGIRNVTSQKEEGAYPAVKNLFVSPMKRCLQTAKIIYPQMEFEEIAEWREIDFGSFEGKNHIELAGNTEYREWVESNGTLPFPNGESREGFIKRVRNGFDKMIFLLTKEDEASVKEAAAIVHGGTIMALCSSLFGGDYFDYQIGCGEGYQCHFWYTAEKNAQILEIKRI